MDKVNEQKKKILVIKLEPINIIKDLIKKGINTKSFFANSFVFSMLIYCDSKIMLNLFSLRRNRI